VGYRSYFFRWVTYPATKVGGLLLQLPAHCWLPGGKALLEDSLSALGRVTPGTNRFGRPVG
jgi:hypothetical protein